jgi:hypothetical protein
MFLFLWKYSCLKVFAKLLQSIFSTKNARKLTSLTGCKFFRFSVERMILGIEIKKG